MSFTAEAPVGPPIGTGRSLQEAAWVFAEDEAGAVMGALSRTMR